MDYLSYFCIAFRVLSRLLLVFLFKLCSSIRITQNVTIMLCFSPKTAQIYLNPSLFYSGSSQKKNELFPFYGCLYKLESNFSYNLLARRHSPHDTVQYVWSVYTLKRIPLSTHTFVLEEFSIGTWLVLKKWSHYYGSRKLLAQLSSQC